MDIPVSMRIITRIVDICNTIIDLADPGREEYENIGLWATENSLEVQTGDDLSDSDDDICDHLDFLKELLLDEIAQKSARRDVKEDSAKSDSTKETVVSHTDKICEDADSVQSVLQEIGDDIPDQIFKKEDKETLAASYNLLTDGDLVLIDSDLKKLLTDYEILLSKNNVIHKEKDWSYDEAVCLTGCEDGDYLETILLFRRGAFYECKVYAKSVGDALDYFLAIWDTKFTLDIPDEVRESMKGITD